MRPSPAPIAALLLLLGPAAARADSVAYDGSTLAYTGDDVAPAVELLVGGSGLDTTLTLELLGLRSRVPWAGMRRGLRFAVTPSAPARWTFVLLGARPGSRAIARRSLPLAPGRRTVTLKPTRRHLGARRRLRLRVRITAIAADGTRAVVIRRLRIR